MQLTIPTKRPFSFAQTLAFMRRFPPCQTQYVLGDDSLTAALAAGGKPIAFRLRGDDELAIEVPEALPARVQQTVVEHAARFVGAADDLEAFYAVARGDTRFEPIVQLLHGLHHVRFLTLAEISVYAVLMQRAPVHVAAASLGKFLAAFGKPVDVPERTLFAMPELAELCGLGVEPIAAAIRHRGKAERIVEVARGVHALGEHRLREAPYAEARDALLAIRGLGPVSAAAILLRGLGRMDELPWLPAFAEHARELYGKTVDHATIANRYGRHIGYWSFYVMTGLPRLAGASARTASPR
jgi:DNA-3-methyladenine glycosylase II